MKSLFCVLSLEAVLASTDTWQSTLKDAGKQHNLMMGTAFNMGHMDDKLYEETFIREYDVCTAISACKWHQIRPTESEFLIDACVDHLKFAHENGKKFRGHNLVWGNYNPDWLANWSGSPNKLEQVLKEHITYVVQNVPKQAGEAGASLFAWDVVNEAIADWPSQDMYKPNVWFNHIPDYVEKAFSFASTAAKDADLDIELFYNDYNMLYDFKTDKVVEMVKQMQQKNIQIDGIGMQGHVGYNDGKANERENIAKQIKKFGDLGLKVHITELTVKVDKTNDWEFTKQAEVYENFLAACFIDNPGVCTAFLHWGMTDKYTWKGPTDHPLPFDKDYNKKHAYHYMLDLLNGKVDHEENMTFLQ